MGSVGAAQRLVLAESQDSECSLRALGMLLSFLTGFFCTFLVYSEELLEKYVAVSLSKSWCSLW